MQTTGLQKRCQTKTQKSPSVHRAWGERRHGFVRPDAKTVRAWRESRLASGGIDVMLLDLRLPPMSGLDLLQLGHRAVSIEHEAHVCLRPGALDLSSKACPSPTGK